MYVDLTITHISHGMVHISRGLSPSNEFFQLLAGRLVRGADSMRVWHGWTRAEKAAAPMWSHKEYDSASAALADVIRVATALTALTALTHQESRG